MPRPPRVALACFAAIACGPDTTPPFDGSYDAHHATEHCDSPDGPPFLRKMVGFTIDIVLEADDTYAVEPPSIDCVLVGAPQGRMLEFAPHDCPSPSDQTDVHGTARWTDDDELHLDLRSTQTWEPAEFWPDGITWTCKHVFELVPLD